MEDDDGASGVEGEGEDSMFTFLTKVYFAIPPSLSLSTHSVRCKRCPAQEAMDSATSSSSPGMAIAIFNLRARSSFLMRSLSFLKQKEQLMRILTLPFSIPSEWWWLKLRNCKSSGGGRCTTNTTLDKRMELS